MCRYTLHMCRYTLYMCRYTLHMCRYTLCMCRYTMYMCRYTPHVSGDCARPHMSTQHAVEVKCRALDRMRGTQLIHLT